MSDKREPSFDGQTYLRCETCGEYVNDSESEAHQCGPEPKEHECTCAGCGNVHMTADEEEPAVDDEVKCCPDCEKPNQFGERCEQCSEEHSHEHDDQEREP